jgi:hypothetical protein
MTVDVMRVRRVWMSVLKPSVIVPMGVRFSGRVLRAVLVLMVLVMQMWVRMRYQLVNVLVLMMFSEVQPDAQSH